MDRCFIFKTLEAADSTLSLQAALFFKSVALKSLSRHRRRHVAYPTAVYSSHAGDVTSRKETLNVINVLHWPPESHNTAFPTVSLNAPAAPKNLRSHPNPISGETCASFPLRRRRHHRCARPSLRRCQKKKKSHPTEGTQTRRRRRRRMAVAPAAASFLSAGRSFESGRASP